MLLSVIIPVYNAVSFLNETIDSVINQDCDDMEVLLVDDGSTDGSADLCDDLAKTYPSVRVIHKENGGVSSARNVGIEAAQGKYLTFIDSDDRIAPGMLTDMLREAERYDADKVFCGMQELMPDGRTVNHLHGLSDRALLHRNRIVNEMLYTGCIGDSFMNTVCAGLFRTELLHKSGLKFQNRTMGEDWLFNMQYCDLCASAVYINQPYYIYVRNGASAMSRYHRHQFEFWLENRKVRKSLTSKYHFSIDQSKVDSQWISKVLFYALTVINNEKHYSSRLMEIFTNKEFESALCNVRTINPGFLRPVSWLLRHKLYFPAIALLRLYSLRIKS